MNSKTMISNQMGQGETRGEWGRGNAEAQTVTGPETIGASRTDRLQARRRRRAERANPPSDATPIALSGHGEIAATHILSLANSSASAFVRRWEALGGRTVAADQTEEIAAIYHGHYATALMHARVAPASRAALYISRANPLAFGALRAWLKATRAAGSQARAYLYGHGAEKCGFVSLNEPARQSSLESLARLWTDGPDTDTTERVDVPEHISRAGESCRTSPKLRAHIRQHVRHYADCLRVYWIMSGSRKSAAGLRADLRMLATAARVARAGGVDRLDAKFVGDGHAAPALLRVNLCNLRQHIAAGDVLLTEQPEASDLILALRRKGKARQYVPPAWIQEETSNAPIGAPKSGILTAYAESLLARA